MSVKLFKFAAWGIGIVFAVFVLLLIALFVDWGRSSSRGDRDSVVQQRVSPDGALVAEIHRATTGMWEGPDTVYVALRRSTDPQANEVYAKKYECDDLSAFALEWNGPKQLVVNYGECHESKFNSPTEFAQENKVLRSQNVWDDVTIQYVDTHRVATH